MNHSCLLCSSSFWACQCSICKDEKNIQQCLKCFLKSVERKKFLKNVDQVISDMTKITSFKQFFSNESLLKIYEVLEVNNVEIHELTKDTIEKVRYMEKFYNQNSRANNFSYDDEIPCNQEARYARINFF
ncbi:unnamed protein product [Brachionus calyciflorus]|uniref:Uncharacterized protein n=1 Tax=Brachionus calyciflorus TaxID=104777 RepID=A0A814LR06_9BILA|nr:unnamed protein product [Brachionus calyciflorus]